MKNDANNNEISSIRAYYFSLFMDKYQADFLSSEELTIRAQRHWHSSGKNGCVFSQAVISKIENYLWETKVISTIVIEELDNLILERLQSKENEVFTMIFPTINSVLLLHNFVREIKEKSKVFKFDTNTFQMNEFTALKMRIDLTAEITSWVTGFGPFIWFPATRQSPLFEIAIRTNPKPDNLFYRLNSDKHSAHLADIKLNYSDSIMEKLWVATYKNTQKILGGKDEREANRFATAKVTFPIKTDIYNQIF